MTENFTHLHVHTQYSLLDGASKIDLLLARAKLGMNSIAITDHGVMYGAVWFLPAGAENEYQAHYRLAKYMLRSRGLTAASAEAFTI